MAENKSSKLGLDTLKEETRRITEDPQAREFVNEAQRKQHEPAPPEKILVVEGYLKNRASACRPQQQLFLLNELADWVDSRASGGRGGVQMVINYLISRGIESVEKEHRDKGGVIFVPEDWMKTK
jgi:hypothetical protein